MYAVGLFRGKIRLFGALVSINFSNDAVSSEDRTDEEAQTWKKCKAVLEAEGCITRAEVGADCSGGQQQEDEEKESQLLGGHQGTWPWCSNGSRKTLLGEQYQNLPAGEAA